MSRPFRYTLILILVGLGTCLAAAGGWRYARASAPVNGPIILVSIDALRADRIPPYGYRLIQTPALDALAADGVVFERAYSHVPQTLPSHASLLSGRLPFETGVRDAVGFTVNNAERLLPEMLSDRGYATAGVVSSFLLRKDTGISQGFTFFDADMSKPADDDTSLRRDGAASERIAEHWLDSVGTSRAFLFLHIAEPHARPRSATDTEQTAYDASVVHADEVVGRLLRYLKTHQLYDRSTILVVSDHGEDLGEHGERGHGLFVYENTLRVPLVVKLPAGESAGRRVKTIVQVVDLVPTILDLAKAPIPGNLRGRSLTRMLEGDDSAADVPVYSESLFARYHFGWGELTSVIDGRYHYIRAPREELYDLETDPQEQNNLAEEQPEISSRLRKTLAGFVRTPAGVNMQPVSAGIRKRIEAFGYVGLVHGSAAPGAEPVNPKDKSSVVEQYRAAINLVGASDWSGATDVFRTLVRQEPTMDLWLQLASSASRAGRTDTAVEGYKRALEIEPEDVDVRLGLATELLRLRRLEETRRQIRKVLENTTTRAEQAAMAHELLARIALIRGDNTLALEEAGLAETANAQRPVLAYVEGRIAFDQRRYADALKSFEPALVLLAKAEGPPLADLLLYTAEAMRRVDRLAEAERLFLEELRESPHSARARNGLQAVRKLAGRSDRTPALAQH